ncbi:acyltransferase domain-containing protein [Amycolatopsis sp. CA-230715]|uniref:acyltransferase domain-containing protein n=1 Tax=Amycolatopsis sp. CA-230715 TaxID=2745196 RepID=UPI001C01DF24|nr:acyltransferase domain-containing protein [Amycolatopsis sp. CA-230715]QWF83744.1 hypothetical protein HUW46_07187 [Amycolatopsis sp. CA-230715]
MKEGPWGEEEVRRWLLDRIALLTGVRPAPEDTERPMHELGVSSRDTVELVTELGELIGRDLPAGLLWRQPTVSTLVESFAGTEPIAVTGVGRAFAETSPDSGGPTPGSGRHRALLDATRAALSCGGITAGSLRDSRTGVYLGRSGSGPAAEQLSSWLELRGPMVTVDTGGAASLVAVHRAVRDLRCGATELALVVGSGVGCGVVLLKRLVEAEGDRVYAVIRGTAVRAGAEAALAEAHAVGGTDPSTVDYIACAHGPVDDFGTCHVPEQPLLVGTSRGEDAGIAALITTALALYAGRVPLPDVGEWPRYAGTRAVAGVGAEDAHVVVQEWLPAGHRARAHVFALSGPTPSVLRHRADELVDWLESPKGRAVPAADLAATLACRDHDDHRATFVASERQGVLDSLRAVADGLVHTEAASADAPAFVFSGYGSQWRAMGGRLLATEPGFRAAVEGLESVFLAQAGFSLRALLRGDHGGMDAATAHPALFGMQLALAGLWRAHGVEPAAVLGHGTGEIAAAVVTGAMAVEDGLWLVLTRARLFSAMRDGGSGAMAVVDLSEVELRELETRFPEVSVAVFSTQEQCTVSGDIAAVSALVTYLDGMGRLARMLGRVEPGSLPEVDVVLRELRYGLGALAPGLPRTKFYSSVLDDPRGGKVFDEEYWVANLRRPVRFPQAVAAALADGHRTFVEIAPHPIAGEVIARIADATGHTGVRALPTLARGSHDDFLHSVAALHAAGHPTVLGHRYPGSPALDLPRPPAALAPRTPPDAVVAELVAEHRWEERPLPEIDGVGMRSWVLITDDQPPSLARSVRLATKLTAAGDEALALPIDQIDEFPSLVGNASRFAGVVLLFANPDRHDRVHTMTATVLRRLGWLRLYLAVHGDVTTDETENSAALRGLVRALAAEHPHARLTLIDIDEESGMSVLAAELRAAFEDDEVIWRDGHRFVTSETVER